MKTVKSYYQGLGANLGHVHFALVATREGGKRSYSKFYRVSRKYGLFTHSRYRLGYGKILIFRMKIERLQVSISYGQIGTS